MFLIVGLGNPGAEYANTRHNAGFMAAEAIAEEYGFGGFRAKFDGLIAEGEIAGEKGYILKPQTFMNLSGNSVVKAANFYKILPQNVVVIHDDMDLPLGKLKAKIGGGSGGHNGLKSIDAAITPNYNRIRIGIGRPQGAKGEVVDFVLSRFGKAEALVLARSVTTVSQTIGLLLQKGMGEYASMLGQLPMEKEV
ncbi:MAG: aminoacyl-tRNA hydrolase [Alphaproteobacteria bacterium]|nr:aminoacyl-tRNA hydrolase [Alphaproteobacteria bacterium]